MSTFQLIIEAHRKDTYLSDIALDDITFAVGPCNKENTSIANGMRLMYPYFTLPIQNRNILEASCGFYRLDASLSSSCIKLIDLLKQLAADLLLSSRNKGCGATRDAEQRIPTSTR